MAYTRVNLQTGAIIGQGDIAHIEDGIVAAAVATDVSTALATKAPTVNPTFTGTVTGVTKGAVGLGNVDNTSDANKPISTAVTGALATKAPLESPNFTGSVTINGSPISAVAGSGGGSVDAYSKTQVDSALALKAPLASPAFTGTVTGITKSMVGLGNVDNTADLTKFTSWNTRYRIEYTGTAWPLRSTAPTGYTGPILWDSEIYSDAPSPTGATTNDRWARKRGSDPNVGNTLATLTRANNTLLLSGVPHRFSGANAYWLGLDDNNGVSSGSFPSKNTITNAMFGMQQMGIDLVRGHTIGISTGTSKSYETAAGVYNDANLDAADWAVYQASLRGIYLMVPLTDNWNYYHGGKWNFVHWAYQANSSGITDTPGTIKDDTNERIFFANTPAGLRVRALFKDYISHWLNHVNPYTGLAYKDDPTIAIIETGNELYYAAQLGTNEWTQDIAAYIKSIAPNKLVADGSASNRTATSAQPGLTAPSVDIVGAHYYPQTQGGSYPATTFNDATNTYPAGSALQQLIVDAAAATNANKSFIVGEYPWTRTDIADWYSAIENNPGIDADMFWSFVANTDAGVPEVHGDVFGSDDYPVHAPFSGSNETTYGPALSQHIKKVS